MIDHFLKEFDTLPREHSLLVEKRRKRNRKITMSQKRSDDHTDSVPHQVVHELEKLPSLTLLAYLSFDSLLV